MLGLDHLGLSLLSCPCLNGEVNVHVDLNVEGFDEGGRQRRLTEHVLFKSCYSHVNSLRRTLLEQDLWIYVDMEKILVFLNVSLICLAYCCTELYTAFIQNRLPMDGLTWLR